MSDAPLRCPAKVLQRASLLAGICLLLRLSGFVSTTKLGREPFEMSKKSEREVSSAVAEMSDLVRYAATPAVPGERVPHAIARAARRLGFDRGRVESFWYGKARTVTPEELDKARAVAVERAKDAELLRNEYRRAVDILARLETRLAAVDEDFHGPAIDALRHVAGSVPRAGSARRDGGAAE